MDRNKTELTHHVTTAAYNWLDERGFKPIETEVYIQDGWIADLAGIVSPTLTELQNLKLLKRRPKWNQAGYKEWWPAAKALQESTGTLTAIVEVKTSPADFRNDTKWGKSIPAQLAYLAIPQEMQIDREPEGWGLLLYSDVSKTVRCVKVPRVNNIPLEQKFNIVLEIAIRRDHHTRYERHRDLVKQMRNDENERISRTRVTTAWRAMLAIVRGEHESVERTFEHYGVKHIPSFELKEIEKLFGIAKPATLAASAK
jgi:hypothetical protein